MTDANQQTDDEKIILPEIQGETSTESSPESSAGSEERHEENQNDGVQKRFNKLTFEKYEAQREAERLKAEIEALKSTAEHSPAEPKETPLVAPQMPEDVFDNDAMAKYHNENQEYLRRLAKAEAEQLFKTQSSIVEQEAQSAKQREILNTYVNNAIKDGVDTEKLRVIENTLIQAGLNQQLGEFLMRDKNGAKIAEYLTDNPAEMYDVLSLDPVSAGIKISTEIKQKALSTTPNVSGAPDPIPDVKGGGYIEKDDFSANYPGAEII